ncbi:tryptophan synthase subunit beta [Streptomyces sp. NBC_00083]|uniref:tryptophan synthase subunit beta n=1 Tax=Streptomyces sp. NBC_00083 TaxID=2975647 RepID=UPI00225A1738|nr:tryptophan synthase subunit beta [Streptomyces sp. NBC_00083]MCX5382362.1 tryptophan synthase subunit beta [Streptomyces sp. NBC_00083]
MTGRFGDYGGQFVAETLVGPLEELWNTYLEARQDSAFEAELNGLLATFVGRPTPITRLRRLGIEPHGVTIWLKREDLTHTGAHKINNAIGQALLASRLGKRRIIAETGAGQHGVAVAAACAYLGLDATIYMGRVDAERQLPNLQRMRLLGAEVRLVDQGTATLKDAVNEAIREWITHPDTTHYLLGSVVGPHPFPSIVRDFQSVIGREAREQFLAASGRLPDAVIACVGGGSNSIGVFSGFLDDPVRLIGVQAAGDGSGSLGHHAAPLIYGEPGVLQGMRTYLLQDDDGQVLLTHSIAPGLDYPGAGPEHSHLKDSGRVEYLTASDDEALDAFQELARSEGIVPALESSHAVAAALRVAPTFARGSQLLVNLSGRGDKDLTSAMAAIGQRKEQTGGAA